MAMQFTPFSLSKFFSVTRLRKTTELVSMASIGITASIHRARSSHHFNKEQSESPPAGWARSLGTRKDTHVVPSNLEGHDHLNLKIEKQNSLPLNQRSNQAKEETQHVADTEHSLPKFFDERWKNGTWDLNMFVKRGKMDWNAVIVAEARRRRFLELYPEAATNQEPFLFRSSIVPWWAWITHSHLPKAELLNGRAAMVGFFTAYFVDALTRLDVVGQTGNFVCKAALFATVVGVVLFRRREDFGYLQKLADEATFYDRQWQTSWQDQDSPTGTSKQGRINI